MAWCEPPATSLASIPDSTRQEQSGVLSGFVAISACVNHDHPGIQHEGHDGLCQDGGLKHALKPGGTGNEVAQSWNILCIGHLDLSLHAVITQA